MESYIVINGKKAPLTEEQLKMLGIKMEKESSFARCKDGEEYYYIEYNGDVCESIERSISSDTECYNVANYCTDENLMQQRAWHETLSRLLWRYSMEHDGDKIKMSNDVFRYGIKKRQDGTWNTYPTNGKLFGAPMFYGEEIAQNAIKEIIEPFMKEHPDFVW